MFMDGDEGRGGGYLNTFFNHYLKYMIAFFLSRLILNEDIKDILFESPKTGY